MIDDRMPDLAPMERFNAEKEYAKETFETEFKSVGYLLAAHGTGLVGSLSVLKDYNGNSQLKGVGVFITLFAVGFMMAIISFVTVYRHCSEVMTLFLGDKLTPAPSNVTRLVWGSHMPQLLSALVLILALLGIVVRFAHL
ncbi:hypothetical protein ACVW1A_000142 [Bradyrhizobium sp. LB1.3]